MEDVLRAETIGAVRLLTLCRPHRMNALDMDLAAAFRDAVVAASREPDVRALVITGAGGNFCTGADVRRDRSRESAAGIDLMDIVQEAFLVLRHGAKPSVAAVQGHVRGAGLSLMLACDFAVADSTALFAAQFTSVGLAPDMGLAITLPERVGIAAARDMVLCGTEKGADEALSVGLVDTVCGAGGALAASMEKAGVLASRAPLATAAARCLLNRTRDSVECVLREESKQQSALRKTEDAKEAIAAFAGKRKPVFRGL